MACKKAREYVENSSQFILNCHQYSVKTCQILAISDCFTEYFSFWAVILCEGCLM